MLTSDWEITRLNFPAVIDVYSPAVSVMEADQTSQL